MKGMPKVIAVTGGSGQFGTLVLRKLAADPDVLRIVSIDVSAPFVASPKLQPITADIRDCDLGRYFAGCEGVVHCAFRVTRGADPSVFRSINIDGSINVFTAAVTAGVGTIVHMSSIMAYGCFPNHPVPIREMTPRIDQTDFPYASSKFQLEAFLDQFEHAHPEVAISRIRANILIGRHMRHLLGSLLLIRRLPDLDGTLLPIVWDEDVADLVMLALRQRARGAFNAAADELLSAEKLAACTEFRCTVVPRPLVELYRVLHGALAVSGIHFPDPAWYDKTKGAMLVASSERAKSELGWRPHCATARAVLERFLAVVPLGLDFRVQLFLCVVALSCRRLLGADRFNDAPIHINLCLNGRGGRDLTLHLQAGRLAVSAGPRANPTSTIELHDRLFRKLLVGAATADCARRDGEITIEGNAADWQVFTWLVAAVAALQHNGGWRGFILRGMARLIALSKSIDQPNCRAAG